MWLLGLKVCVIAAWAVRLASVAALLFWSSSQALLINIQMKLPHITVLRVKGLSREEHLGMGGDVVSRFKVRIYDKAYGNLSVSKQISKYYLKQRSNMIAHMDGQYCSQETWASK